MTRVGNKRKLGTGRDYSDWEHSSVVERFFDTEKALGSFPSAPILSALCWETYAEHHT